MSGDPGAPGAVRRALVVGAGLMGGGIAQVCAQAGIEVRLFDADPGAAARAREAMGRSLARRAAKGVLPEGVEAVLARVRPAADLPVAAADVDLAVEAVFEDREVKREVFRRLDQALPEAALLASNTSAIPISALAGATRRPERVLGLHFFSPVPLMQAVEVIRGDATGGEAMERGLAFVRQLGKVPIRVNRDVPGFVINRINLPSTLEAIRLVEEGVTTVEDVDQGVKLALGRKLGIFETGDLVGLDVTLGALTALAEATGDPRWAPPVLLRQKVAAGHLGRKTGRGWYEYDEDGQRR